MVQTSTHGCEQPLHPSREELESQLTGMYSTYPTDWEQDFDYNLDFGASDVYSDSVMVETLLDILRESGVNTNRAKSLAEALVNEGSIIMGENRMIEFIDQGRNLCNLGAEEMFFIQFITSTGWNLSGFGHVGVWWGESDTFCLTKHSATPAMNEINNVLRSVACNGGNHIKSFGEDIGRELFKGLVI